MMREMAVMYEECNVTGIYNCRKLFREMVHKIVYGNCAEIIEMSTAKC